MEKRMELTGGGWLTVRREGPRAVFEAVRPNDQKGLYKVWLRGTSGKTFLLGTLAPQDRELRLRRTLSLGELEQAGCWPEFRAESVLAFSFAEKQETNWYCEQHPERFFTDPLLKKNVPGPMLCRREKNGFLLAAPFRPDRPVALPSLFCLARVEKLPSGIRLVWRFDEKGWPIPGGHKVGA
ncbi:hypothetical protein ACTQ4E_05430 [Lawsonibacter sp. LCP25S3_G6]|uniref:hypothetical protein n=1 Tax=unclassified Lawsonibacter TaxID=2617946 RepID=UPI003F946924